MKALPFSQVINNGIQKLAALQKKDGSFPSLSSSSEQDFSNASTFSTTFLSSIILTTLASFPFDKRIIKIRKKTADFLLIQKSAYWSWNYWTRESQEAKDSPYPDDLDDTFCALAALSHYNKKIINGDVFAHIVKMLTFTEKEEGGPYKTWLIKKNAPKVWKDIDIAVNANIAYFLSLHEITLPNLEKYFDSKIKMRDVSSPYYPSFYAPLYFISRFYTGKYKDMIENIFWEKKEKNGAFENPLKTALAVLSLLSLGVESERLNQSINYLLKTQKDGLWKPYGFCIDPTKDGKKHFAGSSALTTVFCLAALQSFRIVQQEVKKKAFITEKEDSDKLFLYNKIIKNVFTQLDGSGTELAGKAEVLVQRILQNDVTKQIPLMPYYFYKSLKKGNKKITKSILIKLGMANMLGWIAYTIYDDFFDEEGNPVFLPTATIALRQLVYIYDTFPLKRKKIQNLFHSILDTIDNANMWELKHCRINNGDREHTNFEQLANKSIGHALGPLTLFVLSGYSQESKEFKYLYKFFMHYLVTKQLNDDAHDWEKDLKKGHLTPVVSLLLQKADKKNIIKKNKYLKEFFWQEIIQEVWLLIHSHAKKAKRALHKLSMHIDPMMLELLLNKNVAAADKALEEQKNMKAFLQTYTPEND